MHPVREVLRAFLGLGLTSFGGPVAHIGYFRSAFVVRRAWLTEQQFADLVAISQFLPGPASSQLGFAIGWHRAGWRGAFMAFIGFTLPSALIMFGAAFGVRTLTGDVASIVVTALQLVAVGVVTHAVRGMARRLTPDVPRVVIAVIAAGVAVLVGGTAGQLLAILIGAVAGYIVLRDLPIPELHSLAIRVSHRTGVVALVVCAVLVFGVPLMAAWNETLQLFNAFTRTGALVFGGGHVVLPLLDAAVVEPGWVLASEFAAGYGVAQVIPGPLFTFATYLGAIAGIGPGGALGAVIATVAIFLPGFLLLIGVLPFWNTLGRLPNARALTAGVGAAVVGLLVAALIGLITPLLR